MWGVRFADDRCNSRFVEVLYDATYEWVPTQGWSFLPLDNYASAANDTAARFAPTGANLPDYEFALRMFLGFGAAACYRGTALYSDAAAQAAVAAHVRWYKRFRSLLTRDVIHVRRPDEQGLDAILHADASASDGVVGILLVFNPTDAAMAGAPLRVPCYYTGLESAARVAQEPAERGAAHRANASTSWVLPLRRRDYSALLPVTVAARAATWYTISRP